LTQILEEGMPDVALKQGSASFRVLWSSNPEASGRWHWKDGDHVDKWVSLRRASRQAAAVGGEFERSLAFKIADRLIEGLKHGKLHIPGFTMRTLQDVSEWSWEPPVVDLDGSDGGAADAATPDEAELVLFNRQPEFLVLGEYILAAESVADENPVTDVRTLSKKVFIRIIERIGKLLKASTEDVFTAVKNTGVSVLQREIAKEPFDTKDVDRFERFMMLCETAEQALEISAT